MLNCSDLPSPSLPLNPARLSYRPADPSATSSSASYRPVPGDSQQPGAPAAHNCSRAPALPPPENQGLPTVYSRAPAALASPDNNNQGAPHAAYRPPPPASLYSSLQVGNVEILSSKDTSISPPTKRSLPITLGIVVFLFIFFWGEGCCKKY